MNKLTRFSLVLLRVLIGWHLLFAGVAKFRPEYHGSEGFLRESIGPLAPVFHKMAGDPLVDRLTPQPLPANADPATAKPYERMPRALAAEWDAYYRAFAAHYGLDEAQRKESEAKFQQHENQVVGWLLTGTKEVKKTSPYGPPVEVTRTTAERVADYVQGRDALRQKQYGEYALSLHTPFAADRTRDLAAEKADVNRQRADLSRDLEKYTAGMKEALEGILTPKQAATGEVSGPVRPDWLGMGRLDWIDFLVRWGLVVVGGCLLLGLFSRTACVGGALLLLSFYLAVPPLPGIPAALRPEGYPYVNKNLIELMALLVLATTASGRWAGLDVLLYALNPWRKAVPAPAKVPAEETFPAGRPAAAPVAPSAGPGASR